MTEEIELYSKFFVRKIKELMDLVDPDLVAVEVASTFGLNLKYYLGADDELHETTQATSIKANVTNLMFFVEIHVYS